MRRGAADRNGARFNLIKRVLSQRETFSLFLPLSPDIVKQRQAATGVALISSLCLYCHLPGGSCVREPFFKVPRGHRWGAVQCGGGGEGERGRRRKRGATRSLLPPSSSNSISNSISSGSSSGSISSSTTLRSGSGTPGSHFPSC